MDALWILSILDHEWDLISNQDQICKGSDPESDQSANRYEYKRTRLTLKFQKSIQILNTNMKSDIIELN